MKICIRCKKELSLNKFGKHPTAKDGYRNQCNACRFELRKERPTYKRQIRQYRYGITQDEYSALLIYQNNKCAICKKIFTKTPHIDHCHNSKIIRGLLCGNCNTALGLLGDDQERILAAAQYLKIRQKQSP
jgi:DNA-directed RNA polymerase subunit RPC12/RpoP